MCVLSVIVSLMPGTALVMAGSETNENYEITELKEKDLGAVALLIIVSSRAGNWFFVHTKESR